MAVFGRIVRIGAPLAVLAGALAVASCAGGSTSAPQAAASASAGTTLPTSAQNLSLPAVGGQIVTLGIGAGVPAGTVFSATESLTAPAGAPAPSAARRSVRSVAGAVPFYFVTFTVSQSISLFEFTSEAISLTAADPLTASYFAEFDDLSSSPVAELASFGPGVVAGGGVTITNVFTAFGGTGGTATIPTLNPGSTYLLQLYYVPAGTAGASPSPSPAVSPSPSVAPSSSPSASPSPSPSPSAAPSASPSPVGSPSPGASPLPSPSPSPSPQNCGSCLPDYGFTGPSVSTGNVTPPAIPAQVGVGNAFGTYGVSVTANFGIGGYVSPTPPVYDITTILGANGNGIPAGSGFPFYSGPLVPMFYLELTTTATVSFAETPYLVVTATSYPGAAATTGCSFVVYSNNGSVSPAWHAILGPYVPSGGAGSGTLLIPSQTISGNIELYAGYPFYAFVGC